MKRSYYLLIALSVILSSIMMSCGDSKSKKQTNTVQKEEEHEHNHGHDHDCTEHNHESHEHESHEGHDHDGHDHESNNHGEEAHEGHNHDSHEGGAHVHDAKLNLSAYNEDFELYAEMDPFVKGNKSVILAHLTNLTDFKPLKKGKVVAKLLVEGKEYKQILNRPNHPGIYKFVIEPKNIGHAKLIVNVEYDNKFSELEISHIQVYSDEHTAHHEAGEHQIHTSNPAPFTKEKSWMIDFRTELVKAVPFGRIIKTVARVSSTQKGERIVSAKSSGIVVFSKNDIVEGMKVKKNQSLFRIESNGGLDDDLNTKYQQVLAEYVEAKADFERKTKLVKDKIVSESEYLKSKAVFKKIEATYKNLKKNYSGKGQKVRSSMNGYIKHLAVSSGQYVKAGDPVMIISENNSLYLKAEVQTRYYSALRNIVGANVSIQDGKTYSVKDLNGKLISVANAVEEGSPLLSVLYKIDNSLDLIPGTYVNLYIKTESSNLGIVVPNTALVEEMGRFFVYIQKTPELFEKRLVEVGSNDGKSSQILKGIEVGERLATKGAVLIKLTQSSGAVDPHAGHVH